MFATRSVLGYCLGLIISLCLVLIPPSADAFTANSLGDFNNVAVMEVSGDYDALIDGVWNHEPRKALAREFYRTHGDDYDFLVIFTNFDFNLPEIGAAAYFTPVQNQVQGIGLEQFDYSSGYSADGQPLERLQGTIDMANLSGYVSDPTNPGFETTLKILAHELSHRWGAYIHFIDAEGQESDALLGIADSHWSFLLDSEGSTLYGNNWRDNGDGTFTSIPPEQGQDGFSFGRIYSPLDLYLMGLLELEAVPPFTLLESPGVPSDQPPAVGETIVATARTVTVDQVIAAEGTRLPVAGDSRDVWRIGYLYAVTPGSWDPALPAACAETAAIATIAGQWNQRFHVLTNGSALMQSDFPEEEPDGENPGVPVTTTSPALAPSLDNGVTWLVAQQQEDGFWRDRPGTEPCDTALAVTVLQRFPIGAISVQQGMAWLEAQTFDNRDFLARKVIAANGQGADTLLSRQNPDGGWGSSAGYQSSPLDTALILQALDEGGLAAEPQLADAVAYLVAMQNLNGGWPGGCGLSMVQPTANVLLALNTLRATYSLDTEISKGLSWLLSKQNSNGGFGNSLGTSTVYDTSVVLLALKETGASQTAVENAVTYLLSTQADTGSWNESAFQTALTVQALYAGQVVTDLKIENDDFTTSPSPVEVVPDDILLYAYVSNLGDAFLDDVSIVLYAGENDSLPALQEHLINIPGHSTAKVPFPVHLDEIGQQVYSVAIDPDHVIDEISDNNNFATFEFYAGPPPPTIQFEPVNSSGNESLTSVDVAVSLSHAWNEPVSVDFAATDTGTATAGVDFSLDPGILVIPAGETSGAFALTILNDQTVESNETVQIQLSNPQNGSLGTDLMTYTILDDDLPPTVAITEPIDGQTYFTRTPLFSYISNLSQEKIAVFIDDERSVTSASGYNVSPFSYGTHTIRVEAINNNGVKATDDVSFFIDDTGLPPDYIWNKTGKKYEKMVFSADGGFYGSYGALEKYDRTTWTYQWGLSGQVYDFLLKNQKIYMLREKTDGVYIQIYELGGQLLWEKLSPLLNISYLAKKIAVDTMGNIIVAGQTSVDMGNNKPSQRDVAVYKYTPYGQFLGMRQVGSDLNEWFVDLAVDAAGTIYLAGYTPGSVGIDPEVDNAGGNDFFLARLDEDLTDVRIKQFGTAEDDVAEELCIDSQNNVYLAAYTYGSFDGILPTYDSDAVLIKFNDQFEVVSLLQEHMINRTVNMAVDTEDSVYLAGAYGEYGSYNTNVIMYDAAGEFQWKLTAYDRTLYRQFVTDLSVGTDGSLYLSFFDVYPNYSTGYWEDRMFLRKYGTGVEVDPPPVLTLNLLEEGFENSQVILSGTREGDASVTVSDVLPAVIGAVEYPTATTWSCIVSTMETGDHFFTISVNAANGQSREVTSSYKVSPPKSYQQAWIHQYGSDKAEENTALALDGQNQVKIFGYTDGTWGPNPSTVGEDLLMLTASTDDGLLIQPAWQMDSGSSYPFEYSVDAALTSNDDFYVLWKNAYLDYTSGFIAKFDSSGNELWRQQIDTRQNNYPIAMALDNEGNVFIVGYTKESLSKEPFGGIVDYFVAKYGALGNRQWLHLSGEADELYANDIAVAADGTIWVVGEKRDSYGHSSPLLFKLDNAGVMLSETLVDPHNGTADAVGIGPDGSVYVAGSADLMRGTDQDTYLVKYDAVPNQVWKADFSQAGRSWVDDLHFKGSGEIAVVGSRYIGDSAYPDVELFTVDATGQLAHSYLFASAGDFNDTGRAVTSDASGNIYISGRTMGTINETQMGDNDIFVAKFQKISGPFLEIDPYAAVTQVLTQSITGTMSPGASLTVVVDAPADSRATILAHTQNSDGTWQFTVSNLVPNADNVLTVSSTNEFGTTSETVTISVDTLPPALTVDAVTSPTSQDSQDITGTIEAGSTLTVEINPPSTTEMVPVAAGAWSYAAAALQEGDNVFNFVATDAAGNMILEAATITYESPPSLAVGVVPASILETESVNVMLTTSNISPYGETVTVEQVIDLDQNGLVGADEPVVRRFNFTDGVLVSNPNLQSDLDGLADGSMTSSLNYHFINDRYHAPAQYLFLVSAGAESAAAEFDVTAVSQLQTISGTITDELSRPLPGVQVQLIDKWSRGFGYVVTDTVGQYHFNIERPGEYGLLPMLAGYVYDQTSQGLVNVTAGQAMTGVDLSLLPGLYHVAGIISDAESSAGIPGLRIHAENSQYVASALTAADGSYQLSLPAGDFSLTINGQGGGGACAKGYVTPEEPALDLSVTDHSSGNDISLDVPDVLACGQVIDLALLPVPGAPMQSIPISGNQVAAAITDGNGDYCLGLVSGSDWMTSLRDAAAQGVGLVGTQAADVSVVAGPSLALGDVVAYDIEAWVEGTVTNEADQPVAHLPVALINTDATTRAVSQTAPDGTYRLGINAGKCEIRFLAETLGYEPFAPVEVVLVGGQNMVQDFVLTKAELANTIDVSSAVYNLRKAILSVTASSTNPDARLVADSFGPMTMIKELKGVYTWEYSGSAPSAPATVTVFGPEGSVTVEVSLK